MIKHIIKGIDVSKPVWVYRNLKHGRKSQPLYSIMQNGRVLARRHCILLSNCTFVVRETGRQRVICEGRKNVHAFVVGRLASKEFTPKGEIGGCMGIDETGRNLPVGITYNPYKAGYFVSRDFTLPHKINAALAVLLNES